MSFSVWSSALAFFVIEGDALLDQLEIGHASTMFMLGTACLTAGICIGLFAIITGIGLAISAAFSDEPAHRQPHEPSGSTVPINDPAIHAPTLASDQMRQGVQPF